MTKRFAAFRSYEGFMVALSLGGGLTGCDPAPIEATATKLVEDTLDSIDQNSASWQNEVNKLEQELRQQDLPEAADYVSTVAQRAIAAAGTQIQCEIDFGLKRVKTALADLAGSLHLGKAVPAQPAMPVFCQVSPTGISLRDAPSRLEFYGYDFDQNGGSEVVIEHADGSRENITRFLDVSTHYYMAVNLSNNGARIDRSCQRILLLSGSGSMLSSVGCNNDCPPPSVPNCTAGETKPAVVEEGDCVDSWETGCRIDKHIQMPCDAGFHHGAAPAAVLVDHKGDGNCSARWSNPDVGTDCSVDYHMGLTGGNLKGYYKCEFSSEQVKDPICDSPSAPPGWCSR